MSKFRIIFTTHSETGEPDRLWALGLHGEPIPTREILAEALAAEALTPGGAFKVFNGREPTPAEVLPPVARSQVQPTRRLQRETIPTQSHGKLTAEEMLSQLAFKL